MNNLTRDEIVYLASGRIEAESVKILLESFGLKAYINQESAGATYGLTVGPLGQVEVLVPSNEVEDARRIIKEMEEGKLEQKGDQELNSDDTEESL